MLRYVLYINTMIKNMALNFPPITFILYNILYSKIY